MDYIKEITDIEWEFFQLTQNEGGRSSCQDNRPAFQITRESQFKVWPQEALESYLHDLQLAQSQNRNLVEEKYARMMEYTAPEAYAQIKQYLPPIAPEAQAIVNDVCQIHVDWQLDFAPRYPALSGQGRATTQQANDSATSMEVYWRCELATYSLRTLELYQAFVHEQKAKGVNLNQSIMEYTVKAYGYANLEEAEARILGQH